MNANSNPLAGLNSLKRDALRQFVGALDSWRKVTNLVSDNSFKQVWDRHIVDSLFVFQSFPDARRWLDLGSGAGFPGIVLGICLMDKSGAEVHCVEADGKKCSFLRYAVQNIGLPVKIHNIRATRKTLEVIEPVDAVTARAFSSISNILHVAGPHISTGAVAILPRGRSYGREVECLDSNRYRIDLDSDPGRGNGAVVKVRERGTGLNVAPTVGD